MRESVSRKDARGFSEGDAEKLSNRVIVVPAYEHAFIQVNGGGRFERSVVLGSVWRY